MNGLIGLFGLGRMGSAFAANLIRAGYQVVGFDPSVTCCAHLAALGGRAAITPSDVCSAADVILLSLPSEAALADVARALAASPRGTVAVECSTLPLSAKTDAREVLAPAGWTLLDCPVSGTGAQALERDLAVFASGPPDALARAWPALKAISREIADLGAFGNGTRMKCLANHLVTIHNVASAEVLALAEVAGMDLDLVWRTLVGSAATSRVFEVRGPMICDRTFQPATATINTHLKDIGVIRSFAGEAGCSIPFFESSVDFYYQAAAQGFAEADTASVIEVMAQSRARIGSGSRTTTKWGD